MKTNIFQHKNLTGEDYFTSSFAYIMNLFPQKIGNRLLLKLTDMSGFTISELGEFVEARFIGHLLQNEDSDSKPDLIIETTKTKIFVEVKLRAVLSKGQLERHMKDVIKAQGLLMLISNINTPIPSEIISQKKYLRPKHSSHFTWAEIEPIFRIKVKKNSLDEKILSDFQQSLRTNGMRGRQLFGCTGNLYMNGSDAENLVLDELQTMVKDIGFHAWRKKSEYTLRINMEKAGVDPLLNPRLYSTGEYLNDNCTEECMIIYCLSKHSDKTAIKKANELLSLESKYSDMRIFETDWPQHYVIALYIPLRFIAKGKFEVLDWAYLRKIWCSIYDLLK